jgi:creatinine amidohydrolase
MAEIRWQKLRRDQIADLAKGDPVLLLPIGSIEQHGPHLPIDTDTNSATEVAERAARQLDEGAALVLPAITWGLSPYWLPFAGTITLRPETILALTSDIGSSVAAHGFRRLVIVNGHGGNAGIIAVAATQLADHGIRAYALSYWSLLESELAGLTPGDHGMIGHAGQSETSIQLHLQPNLVDPGFTRIADWTDVSEMASDSLRQVAAMPPLPLIEAPGGIYGNAPLATAETGEQIITLAAERLAVLVRTLPRKVGQPT